jgi:PAT family beta-lactamase induction signal transducer AmpG
LFLGFSSGLPLALTGGTLQAWLSDEKIDIRTIGIFSLVGLPYTFKFLWSPLMDRFSPPGLDRRRSWVLATQILLSLLIAAMGTLSPQHALFSLAVFALLVSAMSASQDIVIDAYRVDLLQPSERGVGATLSVFGYRLAMMVSGAMALILSDHMSWRQTYWIMATLMLLCIFVTFLSPKPEVDTTPPKTLYEAIVGPMTDFFSRPGALALLILIVLYKLGDAFAGALSTRFLLAGTEDIPGMGFSKTDVGVVNKGLGFFVTIVGGLLGGGWMVQLGLYRSLMIFGLLQAFSNLTFMLLATTGKHYGLMVAAIGIENFTGGMGTAAMVALLMSLCHARFSATQFALLSALMALGRVWVGPASGYMVVALGWPSFFFVTFLTALPGLWLLWRLRPQINEADGRLKLG